MKNGIFINFEGIDGSGKTTQIEMFITKLKKFNIPFILLREPGGTDIGEKIRDILLDKKNSKMFPITELLLYSASRFQLTSEKIFPELAKGKIVICDRFYDSTTAYQGYARGIDLDFIKKLNKIATDNLIPDLTFILDITIEERKRRFGNKVLDRLEQEAELFHKKVIDGFLNIAKNEARAKLIKGNELPDNISNKIWDLFLEKYEK